MKKSENYQLKSDKNGQCAKQQYFIGVNFQCIEKNNVKVRLNLMLMLNIKQDPTAVKVPEINAPDASKNALGERRPSGSGSGASAKLGPSITPAELGRRASMMVGDGVRMFILFMIIQYFYT